ncbi:MAG: Ig-like domain-containing protein [Treponema sp.]|jgi:uncharacterized protein YjdB|nr:Ig-like domain-containing protein [Treponema sp.]
MKKRFWQFAAPFTAVLAVISFVFAVAGCGGGNSSAGVTSVTIDPVSKTLYEEGSGFTLTATVLPANAAADNPVTWEITEGNDKVELSATTGGSITVKPKKAGTAKITASAGGKTSSACTVTVKPAGEAGKVEEIVLNITEKDLMLGVTEVITASLDPPDAVNQDITWELEQEGQFIEIEDEDGLSIRIKALALGTAVIKASSDDGPSAQCTITVIPFTGEHVTGVTLDKSAETLAKGGTLALTATVSPSNATIKDVSWTTSDKAVATVSGSAGGTATVSAVGPGTAVITVTTNDQEETAECIITVPAVGIESAAFSQGSSGTKDPGATFALTVVITPPGADINLESIVWDSSNKAVAEVAPAADKMSATVTVLSAAAPAASSVISFNVKDADGKDAAASYTVTVTGSAGPKVTTLAVSPNWYRGSVEDEYTNLMAHINLEGHEINGSGFLMEDQIALLKASKPGSKVIFHIKKSDSPYKDTNEAFEIGYTNGWANSDKEGYFNSRANGGAGAIDSVAICRIPNDTKEATEFTIEVYVHPSEEDGTVSGEYYITDDTGTYGAAGNEISWPYMLCFVEKTLIPEEYIYEGNLPPTYSWLNDTPQRHNGFIRIASKGSIDPDSSDWSCIDKVELWEPAD